MTDIPSPTQPLAQPTAGISTDNSRLTSRANLKKAGQQFESVFIGMMLKSMRQANLGDGLFDSKNSETFRDMVGPLATRLKQILDADAAIYHVVKQIIIASLHGHPQPLVIEAARSGIAHSNQPAFAEVFDGLRGR